MHCVLFGVCIRRIYACRYVCMGFLILHGYAQTVLFRWLPFSTFSSRYYARTFLAILFDFWALSDMFPVLPRPPRRGCARMIKYAYDSYV